MSYQYFGRYYRLILTVYNCTFCKETTREHNFKFEEGKPTWKVVNLTYHSIKAGSLKHYVYSPFNNICIKTLVRDIAHIYDSSIALNISQTFLLYLCSFLFMHHWFTGEVFEICHKLRIFNSNSFGT